MILGKEEQDVVCLLLPLASASCQTKIEVTHPSQQQQDWGPWKWAAITLQPQHIYRRQEQQLQGSSCEYHLDHSQWSLEERSDMNSYIQVPVVTKMIIKVFITRLHQPHQIATMVQTHPVCSSLMLSKAHLFLTSFATKLPPVPGQHSQSTFHKTSVPVWG